MKKLKEMARREKFGHQPRKWLPYAICAFVAISLVFVSLIEVDRVVAGRGKTVLRDPKIVLRPPSSAQIKELHVHVGEQVARGAPVVTLDPTVSESELRKFTDKVASYESEAERLRSVIRDAGRVRISDAIGAESDRRTAELSEFEQKLGKYHGQEAGLREKINEYGARLPLLAEQLKIAAEIERMWDDLVNKENYGSQLNWFKASQDRSRLQSQYSEVTGELAKTRMELKRTVAEREGFVAEWRVQKLQTLMEAERNLNDARQEAAKAAFEKSTVILAAPEDSLVVEVSDVAIGTVVTPGDVLVKLVPAKLPEYVDIRIPAAEVSFIAPGMPVDVKLDSAPFQKHGYVRGALESVTYDSFEIDNGSSASARDISSNVSNIAGDTEQFYLARIRLVKNELKNLPEAFRLLPGMNVEADIKVGSRRLVEYLLFPVMRVANEGMREP